MHRPAHRPMASAVAVAVAASALFAASPAIAGAERVRAGGQLVRHDTLLVPDGARARVDAVYNSAGDSIVILHVWGMAPNTEYGAHAHVNACSTSNPLASGPHYQRLVAPTPAAATTPQFANPTNEIWLDLETDADGNGVARTKVPWQFEPARRAKSVVIHQEHTHTGPADSGIAGARLACLSVGF